MINEKGRQKISNGILIPIRGRTYNRAPYVLRTHEALFRFITWNCKFHALKQQFYALKQAVSHREQIVLLKTNASLKGNINMDAVLIRARESR